LNSQGKKIESVELPKKDAAKIVRDDLQPQEIFGYPYLEDPNGVSVGPVCPGQMNRVCGYNPPQLFSSGLPTNLAAGNCMQDPIMKNFNENLFTSTIVPGVYTTDQIIEPINSNIGISFNQQFPPTTVQINDETQEMLFTQHDPRILQEEPPTNPIDKSKLPATNYSITDPRSHGYGTSYRMYNDNLLGSLNFTTMI